MNPSSIFSSAVDKLISSLMYRVCLGKLDSSNVEEQVEFAEECRNGLNMISFNCWSFQRMISFSISFQVLCSRFRTWNKLTDFQ